MDKQISGAILSGDIEAVAALCKDGSLSALPSEDKKELAHLGALSGHAEMLRCLCERCAAVELCPDPEGRDVLHKAVLSGDPATVEFAVERLGFDPARGDRNGVTPLDLAQNQQIRRYLEKKAGFTLGDCYRNPVRRGFSPDPSVVRAGDDYYLVNSSFVEFPCLPVSRSKDLVHWKTVGHAIEKPEWSGLQGLPGGFGYWAPDISFCKGQFWVIATLRRNTPPFRLQMLTHAERPEGPWSKPVALDIDGIDPSLFTDDDGRRYVLTNPGAQIVPIDDEGRLLAEPRMLYYGSNRRKSEGPHLLKKDGWYYLFQAEGGTGSGHMETVSRSKQLYGPYEPCPFNPILGRREQDAPIQRSGHGKPFATPDGRWFMLYLCGRPVEGRTVLGRETALDPMTWTADGWPMVNGLKGPSCVQKNPLPPCAEAEEPFSPMDFMSPRGDRNAFAQRLPDGWRIRCGKEPTSLDPVSLLLRRQQEAVFRLGAAVDAAGLQEGDIAGLTGYYDEVSWMLFGLRKRDGKLTAELITRIGDEERTECLAAVEEGIHLLGLHGEGLTRVLLLDGREVGRVQADFLSDEGAKGIKRFTGALNGLAAVGKGSADFTGLSEKL